MIRMKITDLTTNGSYMTTELVKQGNDIAQNVHVCFTNAIAQANCGGDYDTEWEKAMQYQSELLSVINKLK